WVFGSGQYLVPIFAKPIQFLLLVIRTELFNRCVLLCLLFCVEPFIPLPCLYLCLVSRQVFAVCLFGDIFSRYPLVVCNSKSVFRFSFPQRATRGQQSIQKGEERMKLRVGPV